MLKLLKFLDKLCHSCEILVIMIIAIGLPDILQGRLEKICPVLFTAGFLCTVIFVGIIIAVICLIITVYALKRIENSNDAVNTER